MTQTLHLASGVALYATTTGWRHKHCSLYIQHIIITPNLFVHNASNHPVDVVLPIQEGEHGVSFYML